MFFEVEKKFILNEKQREKLLEGAEFLSEKKFTDTYFDNDEFSLGLSDMWLGKRDKQFSLKIPVREKKEDLINKYHEIEGELTIREIFAIPIVNDFEKDLKSFGHKSFCTFQTALKKYTKEGFIIDLDEANFGDWQYELAKIKLLVKSENQMKDAEEKIREFASRFGLEVKHVNGELIEFIKREIPEIYERLKKEKIAY
ncbi:MAG: hypothetical protein ACD_5C00037G0012 [uncultured bacterium]|nr:MAG: hypothetical protein ACD_5C00037G0012 [uncultured bacterium]